jgi:hypothetical protein
MRAHSGEPWSKCRGRIVREFLLQRFASKPTKAIMYPIDGVAPHIQATEREKTTKRVDSCLQGNNVDTKNERADQINSFEEGTDTLLNVDIVAEHFPVILTKENGGNSFDDDG